MLNAIGIPLLKSIDQISERNDVLLKAGYLYGVRVYGYSIYDIPSYRETGLISAYYWDGGQYRECKIDLPKYTEIYCSTSQIKQALPELFQWLWENTEFTDALGLPKFDFQRKLLLSELSQYAVPTIVVNSIADIIRNAELFEVSFLKPSNGRKALGAMKIEKKENGFYYSTPENSGALTEEALSRYYEINGFQADAPMMIEPCLNILNDDGRAVDFRCLVSLNGEGEWQNVLTYARIGGTGVASNFSHGGSLNFAEEVLEELLPGKGKEKLAEINEVALKVAAFVRKESTNPVSWLGLDICVDRPSNQVYVIEANSKPGTKLVGPWPLALVRAQHYKYILEHGLEKP